MFSNEFFTKWVTVDKAKLIGNFYTNAIRTWLRSPNNPTAPAPSLSKQ